MAQGVNARDLKASGACDTQRYAKAWGGTDVRVAVTRRNLLRAAALRWDIGWLANRMLSATALAEYGRMMAPVWTECDRITAPAWAEYERVRAAAWAEYARATAAAWAEFNRARVLALADCLGLP